MKKWIVAVALTAACCGMTAVAQDMKPMQMGQMGKDGKPLPSPRKMADVDLKGTKIMISYGAPSLRGRKMMGVAPYNGHGSEGQDWWRTGANEATSFETTGNLKVGTLNVPAGKYTLVTLPGESTWQLVVCKHTGQWGTERFVADDLGKTAMMKAALPASQEQMSINFEKTMGGKTQLHIKWATTDVFVPVATM